MGERLGEQPEHVSEREKKAEFTAPSWQVRFILASSSLSSSLSWQFFCPPGRLASASTHILSPSSSRHLRLSIGFVTISIARFWILLSLSVTGWSPVDATWLVCNHSLKIKNHQKHDWKQKMAVSSSSMTFCDSESVLYSVGEQRHDQKEFVWTLHKSRDDWESKIKWPNNNDNNNNNNTWKQENQAKPKQQHHLTAVFRHCCYFWSCLIQLNRSYKYNRKFACTGISTSNGHISKPVALRESKLQLFLDFGSR